MSSSSADQREASGSPLHEAVREDRKMRAAKRHFLQVWTLVGACVLTAVVVYLLNVLAIPVGIIIWTVIICFILSGPVNFFEQHGIKRAWGTLLAYVLMFAVLALLLFITFSPTFGISEQFQNMVMSLPDYAQSVMAAANGFYDRYADVLSNYKVREALDSIAQSFASWASGVAASSASGVVSAGAAIGNVCLVVGFAFVVAFWMLMEAPGLGREVRRIVGDDRHEELAMLHATVTRVMGGYIKGTLIQCAIIGVGCGVLFAIVGTPNAAAFGVITGLLNIIPVVGPWLGGFVAALSSLFISPFTAFVALIGTIAIQQAVYTFVSPKLVGNAVDIHPALTFIALMAGSGIGAAMSGLSGSLVGALLSIPAVAVMKSVFVYYFEKRTGRRIVSPDGVFFCGKDIGDGQIDPMVDATGLTLADAEAEAEARERAGLGL